MNKRQGRFVGEARCDDGMRRAARRKEYAIRRSAYALLVAIRGKPDRTATTDDAVDDLSAKFSDGGRWRGTVPRRLAANGLIVKVAVVKSARPHRHRGYLTRWRGVDDAAIDSEIAALRRWLAEHAPPEKENPAMPVAGLEGGVE